MHRSWSLRSLRALSATLPTLALLLSQTAVPARADDESVDPDVARVSVLAGSVDVKRGDSGDTVAAAINAPISTGDYITTDDASHTELQFDYGTALRVGANTQLRFTQLQPNDHELQLAQGTVDLRLFRGTSAHPEIQTPQVTVRPDQSGSYIVNVDDDGNTQVTVRAGRADVVTDANTQTLVPGTTLAITGSADSAQFQSVDTVAYGDFDAWNVQRDRVFASAADYRYTDAGIVGAEDLRSYGRWVDYPQYGQVWIPAVESGWAPYHDGRWVWEPYYGWTWVDAEPWGWAPFHYGNWFYAAGTGWAWYPGSYAVARPYYYRPALVAFFNFGGGSGGVSIGFGNVGWVPIAPYEPFHPWWHGYGGTTVVNTTVVNNTYVNSTTINTSNITTIYRNANAPGGAVGVTNGHFANGNFHSVVAVDPVELRQAQPIRTVVPVVPTQRNLAFDNRITREPVASSTRFTTFRAQPRTIAPPFAQQQTAVKEAAVRTYPEQAEAISRFRPAPQRDLDTPATARRMTPQYVRPSVEDRNAVAPESTPVRTAPIASPYERFNHDPSQHDGAANAQASPSGERAPQPSASAHPKRHRAHPVPRPTTDGTQR